MKTVTLNILASDIRETKYYNSSDCAITRAVRRAGYSLAEHDGCCILEGFEGEENYFVYISNEDEKGLDKLNNKVIDMYDYYFKKEESEANIPTDFSVELEFNEKP